MTLAANIANCGPNSASCVPNFSSVLSPVNQLTTPPSFGISPAASAKALKAFALASTEEGSILLTLSANIANCGPNSASWAPKSAMEDPPVNQEVTLESSSAFVRVMMVSTRVLTLSRIVGSNFLAPSMKG